MVTETYLGHAGRRLVRASTEYVGVGVITLDSRLVANAALISCDLEGEAVVLSLRDSRYYGLNTTAARVWGLVQAGATVRHVCGVIVEEFAVDPAQCERDVLAVVAELERLGFVTVGAAE